MRLPRRSAPFANHIYFGLSYEVPGSPSVFTMRSIRGHLELRKKFHETYTMTSMKSYEGYVGRQHCPIRAEATGNGPIAKCG